MIKKIENIISELSVKHRQGSLSEEITSVEFDSRKVKKGCLFVAVKGTTTDGHQYINKAVELGAKAIVCEVMPGETEEGVTYIQVEDSSKALGLIASGFFGNPSARLKLVGITGTNGKTTTVTLLHNLFTKLGYHVGVLSTIRNLIGDKEYPATHTTPDPVSLNSLLAKMAEEGCEYCFMEVSSHAVEQNRIAGLHFAGGVFSNLTHDHLDYHKTFENYLKAKQGFFNRLSKTSFALTNTDDKNGTIMVQNSKAEVKTYSVKSLADYDARIIESHFVGMLIIICGKELWSRFIGEFNGYNLLAVYAVAKELGAEEQEILQHLSDLSPVEGRFECLRSKEGLTGIVDYAHTPDALKNVLKTINQIRVPGQQIITVVGTGGDRDKTKRPVMAKTALELSDKVILTSDNPRTEKPESIIEDMMAGVDSLAKKKTLSITDRKEAIRTAVMLGNKDDIILVAGKGHETYQEINGVRHHFDDREILRELFEIN